MENKGRTVVWLVARAWGPASLRIPVARMALAGPRPSLAPSRAMARTGTGRAKALAGTE